MVARTRTGGLRVVCDSGPLLHLYEAASLDLLARTGDVAVPRAVDAELARLILDWRAIKPPWLSYEVTAAQDSFVARPILPPPARPLYLLPPTSAAHQPSPVEIGPRGIAPLYPHEVYLSTIR